MKVKASLNNLRIAPRKSKIVADLIKDLDVNEALSQLDVHIKGASPYLKKLLSSAVANGENNLGIDRDNMYVYDAIVGAGPVLKRWMPKAFGRAGKILKRTSNIEIVLEERIEGKGRKTKEQLEKEKKEKAQQKKNMEKKREQEKEKAEKESEKIKPEKIGEAKKEKSKKDNQSKNWASRVFRRKSM